MFFAAAFVLFSLSCAVLAFARHPIYGLYFYLATTYVYPPGRWWGQLLPDLRWALLSSAVMGLAVLYRSRKLEAKPLWLASAPAMILVLYNALMWLQTPLAVDLQDHLNGASIFTKYMLVFWFIYRMVDSKQRVTEVLLGHVIGCGILGVYAQVIGRDGDRLDGVGGPGIDDSNTLGMYLVTGALVAVGLVLSQKGWRRYVSLGSLVLIANGFVLANSRGAFLGLVAGGAVLAFSKARQHRKMFWSFAVAALLGLTVLIDQAFIDRMFTIQDVAAESEDADQSARSRVVIAQAQLRMFLDHPLGVGHRGTAALSGQYLEEKWLTKDKNGSDAAPERSSHNTFLTTLVEQGVPGALLFVSLILWTLVAALRLRRLQGPSSDPAMTTLGASMCGALISVFVAGNTADYLLAEVQFWLLPTLVSVFWLSESRNLADNPVGSGARLPQPVV